MGRPVFLSVIFSGICFLTFFVQYFSVIFLKAAVRAEWIAGWEMKGVCVVSYARLQSSVISGLGNSDNGCLCPRRRERRSGSFVCRRQGRGVRTVVAAYKKKACRFGGRFAYSVFEKEQGRL